MGNPWEEDHLRTGLMNVSVRSVENPVNCTERRPSKDRAARDLESRGISSEPRKKAADGG